MGEEGGLVDSKNKHKKWEMLREGRETMILGKIRINSSEKIK